MIAALAATVCLVLPVGPAQAENVQCGGASWYALTSKTASGEPMRADRLTAAHKKLPFGTRLKVVNKRNGKTVVVRVNDRGPFVKGRILDLSKAAASELGFIGSGHTEVCAQILARP
ncbi:MAG: septal ring lytic transglycosylase RlpA family protein [Nitratireductor sp.]